jgi:hypothetical protein
MIYTIPDNKDKRQIVCIGDIHSCEEELMELLSKIDFNPTTTRLVFAGDILDRGPNPVECVRFVRKLCEAGEAECVRGNHEDKHIRYRNHETKRYFTGTPNPMRLSKQDALAHSKYTDADIDWMRRLPLSIHLRDNFYMVHAGPEPAYLFNQQSPSQITRCRYVNEKGIAVPLKNFEQPPNTVHWTEVWNGPESIVAGHFVNSLKDPLVVVRPNGTKNIVIDTGACYGGRLTSYNLDTDTFTQVQAKKVYYEAKFNIDE